VIPGRVSNLVFEEINSTSVYVTWSYPIAVANDKELQKMMAFKVSYLIHAHMQQEVDVGITNKPNYLITGLKPGTRYSIIIKSRFKTRKDWNVPPFFDNFQTVAEG
jgi:fibronectin type III domain